MIFVKQGTNVYIPTDSHVSQYDILPVGNYLLRYHCKMEAFYLEKTESFNEPLKIYGDVTKTVDRMLRTFVKREASTGILLSGEKGSGKTLTAKMLSIVAARSKMPTIIVDEPHHGPEFNLFVQNVSQPVIILFDEFEKVYCKNEHQQAMLTLLDGVFPSKKLFVMTVNNKYAVDQHMRNRPGRIYYSLEFGCISEALIIEYCEENLTNKAELPRIKKLIGLFESFNFDMLQSLIEEMNRYNESAIDAIKMLNIKPHNQENCSYSATLTENGESIYVDEDYKTVYLDPLNMGSFSITYKVKGKATYASFSVDDLKQIHGETGTYTYERGAFQVVLTKQKNKIFDIYKNKHLLDS